MFEVQDAVEVTLQPDKKRWHGIIQFANSSHLIIACDPKEASRLQPGMQLSLVQLVHNSVYEMNTPILGCRENCFVVAVKQPALVETRRSDRIVCELPGWYVHDQVVPFGKDAQTDGRGNIRTADLSMGGAKIYADQMLPMRTRCKITLRLNEEETIDADSEILRCHSAKRPAKHPDMPFVVAVKFVGLSRVGQLQLQRYLQQQQPKDPAPART